jgi:hypothetical protein
MEPLNMKTLADQVARIQAIFDKLTPHARISTDYLPDADGYLSIPIFIDGADADCPAYIELAPPGDYDETAALGIDAQNVFEKYKYSANTLNGIKEKHARQLLDLAADYML